MKVLEFIERVERDMTTGGREQLRLLSLSYLNNAMRSVALRTKKPLVNGRLLFTGDYIMGLEDGELLSIGSVWVVKDGRRWNLPYLSTENGLMDEPADTTVADDKFMWRVSRELNTDGIAIYRHRPSDGIRLVNSLTQGETVFGAQAVIAPMVKNESNRIPFSDNIVMGALTMAVKANLAYDIGQIERGAMLWQLFERSVAEENIDMKGFRQVQPDTHMLRK